jgi:hypothetical protein
MANRRSPKPKIEPEELESIKSSQNGCCSLCRTNVGDDELEAEHIVPLRSGSLDVGSNVNFICQLCNRMKKQTIRIPAGLAMRATKTIDTSLAEVVRQSLVHYMDSLDAIENERTDSGRLQREVSRLERKVDVYAHQLKSVQEALDSNPFGHYLVNDDKLTKRERLNQE